MNVGDQENCPQSANREAVKSVLWRCPLGDVIMLTYFFSKEIEIIKKARAEIMIVHLFIASLISEYF